MNAYVSHVTQDTERSYLPDLVTIDTITFKPMVQLKNYLELYHLSLAKMVRKRKSE